MNTPSIFIFESLEKKRLPTKLLVVFLKNLFRYGLKEVKVVNGRVHLYLSYSPKNATVEGKIKNLPLQYIRVVAEDEAELQLFLQGMKEFSNVNFYPSIEEENTTTSQTESSHHHHRPDEVQEPKQKKIKILENRMVYPTSSQQQQQELIEVYDDDADEYEGQKYTVLSL
ncbi:uncharacterized protein LOC115874650 [Sitophilus oryzae]|uniref:Uncharacterized protein LOC115874650 n=1 Tax=Sitophilus oryzae TaxID=7048 RepID=A0A6J2X3E4_SITOR|nr:uncharacterized protein LOC115874650 [Sitophilus oryzae]